MHSPPNRPLAAAQERGKLAVISSKMGSMGARTSASGSLYRASKAALNQLVHTAAIELKWRNPQAICIALHPGTVDTGLSSPFAKSGLEVRAPDQAAMRLLDVVEGLAAGDSGGFFNHDGSILPW
mgnify:CR=1 FL=1